MIVSKIVKLLTGQLFSIILMFACTGSGKRSDLMEIKPLDAYHLQLSSPKFPGATLSLWLPELVIFNHDRDRAECKNIQDWYQQKGESLFVAGETEGKKKVSFECNLTPITEDELLLVLSITNTGEMP